MIGRWDHKVSQACFLQQPDSRIKGLGGRLKAEQIRIEASCCLNEHKDDKIGYRAKRRLLLVRTGAADQIILLWWRLA